MTARAPEPDVPPPPPRTLREAIWEPFVGFFRQSRALEIAAFLFFYKFADNLATALVSPFLGQLGYDPYDIGIAQGTIGIVSTIAAAVSASRSPVGSSATISVATPRVRRLAHVRLSL